jgi:hypothetical protein
MPVTRATGIATPESSSPNNNHPTSDGTISSANPVPTSPRAAKIRTLFIASISRGLYPSLPVDTGLQVLGIGLGVLLRFEVERQPIDLAGELEGYVIAQSNSYWRVQC